MYHYARYPHTERRVNSPCGLHYTAPVDELPYSFNGTLHLSYIGRRMTYYVSFHIDSHIGNLSGVLLSSTPVEGTAAVLAKVLYGLGCTNFCLSALSEPTGAGLFNQRAYVCSLLGGS